MAKGEIKINERADGLASRENTTEYYNKGNDHRRVNEFLVPLPIVTDDAEETRKCEQNI